MNNPTTTTTNPLTLHILVDLEPKFLADIMCTALEGGIGYWSCCSGIVRDTHDTLYKGDFDYVSCILEPDDDDFPGDSQKLVLDHAAIQRGLERIFSPQPQPVLGQHLRRTIANAVLALDAGEIDAEAADVIVQIGLFGEVVYG